MLLRCYIVLTAVTFSFSSIGRRPCLSLLRRNIHKHRISMMPEGPEVLNLVNSLHSRCVGSQILDATILSGRYTKTFPTGWKFLQDKLADKQHPILLKHIQSKGKFIWFDCGSFYVFSTLGLSGDWTVFDGNHNTLDNYARVSFTLAPSWPSVDVREKQNNNVTLMFSDMIGYGTLKITTKEELEIKLKSLGPCWLTNRPTFDQFEYIIKKEKVTRPLVKTLMDQKRFSGIGNYILSEVLYRARIHPFAVCGTVVEEKGALRAIYDNIVIVISSSYNSQHSYGNIPASINTEIDEETIWTSTEAISTSFAFLVYRQKKCPLTSLPIVKETGLHGRAIYWVPSVQTLCSPS